MTKNPRAPRVWTNRELEQDSAGYLAAQQAFKEYQAAKEQEAREASDFERFKAEFVRRGGDPAGAKQAYAEFRNDTARLGAIQADEAARQQMRRERMRAV